MTMWVRVAARCLIVIALVLHAGAASDRSLVFKRGQTRAIVEGRITREDPRVCFSVRGRAGQHMTVRIVPHGGLLTSGHVVSPSGKSDGGPGGIVFDDTLQETGVYRICVEPRQQSHPGSFHLQVTVTPPAS
jgi:hypothetical protein